MALASAAAPIVRHIGDDDIPWVDTGVGIELKVLRVCEATGVWVVRNRFQPGVQLLTHKHTGPVDGFTLEGRWHYLEYDFESEAGSFIHEPAGSVHTLHVPADGVPTDVLFVIEGSLINYDEHGAIAFVSDGPDTLAAYHAMCDSSGIPRPDGILA